VTKILRGRQEPDRLMLLIHGKGADEEDLAPLIPHLDPEGRFLTVLPRAPLAFMSGWEWYRTEGIPRGGPELISSVEAVDDLLDEACAHYGFERSQAIVAGFSQGCAITLSLGLRRSSRPRPAGLLGMSVFIQHGTADPLISVEHARRTVTRLGAEGVPVIYRDYPMAHEVGLESVRDAMTWLALILGGDRPTEPVPDFAASYGER
jgi:phospholipase/carboxylesterase